MFIAGTLSLPALGSDPQPSQVLQFTIPKMVEEKHDAVKIKRGSFRLERGVIARKLISKYDFKN